MLAPKPTVVIVALLSSAHALGQTTGLNLVLNQRATPTILNELKGYGPVLDVIPEINAVTLNGSVSQLAAIRRLPYVVGANADAPRHASGSRRGGDEDLSGGASTWNLDAINVIDFGTGRTVGYDGEGVYVAVLDQGLASNWRDYFPEARIDSVHARSFSGGGGRRGSVSEQPQTWQHDTEGHGTAVTSVILGFRCALTDLGLAPVFGGVAPKVTIIPINDNPNDDTSYVHWSSTAARAVIYVANLKISGALGDAPVVINMSQGGPTPDHIERAAIDYAVDHGVVFVAAAGNDADAGMRYPAAYPEVISVAATGWVEQFPEDDATQIVWCLGDIAENDLSQHFVAPFSAWEYPGQDLDVAAPGSAVPSAWTRDGRADYTFFFGTSAAAPHVAGVVALMLQKNPTLTAAQIEAILESTAMPLTPGCRDYIVPAVGHGDPQPTWRRHRNVSLFPFSSCWDVNQTGHGLIQADAALGATPLP